jgi:hypothetical protein
MTTEIPRTIQLISVALSIAALASTPGSDLAAAPKDISEKQGAGRSRNSTERPTTGYTILISQQTAQTVSTTPPRIHWTVDDPGAQNFCWPDPEYPMPSLQERERAKHHCDACQQAYERERSKCEAPKPDCMISTDESNKCNDPLNACESIAKSRVVACRANY